MTIRRRLLAVGGAGGSSTPPPDPTLTEPRQFSAVTGISQNVYYVPTGGKTWRTVHPVLEDSASLTVAFGTHSQGFTSDPMTLRVSLEEPNGTLTPLTFGGELDATVARNAVGESDALTRSFAQGTTIRLRTYAAGDQTVNVNQAAQWMAGNHTTGTWTPDQFTQSAPTPLAILGSCRESVIAPALLGDSIAAQGAWWSGPLNERAMSGLLYGRNVMRFVDLDGREGDTLRGATHLLVEYGVNDLGPSPSVATLWTNAVACYAHSDAQNPGIPIWQTTPTPMVDTTDQCATLAGQTPRSAAARQAWIAFLRDGAPCHPDTKDALAVGATGLRAGQDGHPLQGIVDIAAVVEDGGTAAPTGKWRVDLGPLGGDGTHPSSLGEGVMAGPVATWLDTLTT